MLEMCANIIELLAQFLPILWGYADHWIATKIPIEIARKSAQTMVPSRLRQAWLEPPVRLILFFASLGMSRTAPQAGLNRTAGSLASTFPDPRPLPETDQTAYTRPTRQLRLDRRDSSD